MSKKLFRVIHEWTGEEADIDKLRHEGWAKKHLHPPIIGWVVGQTGWLYLLDMDGQCAVPRQDRFRVEWEREKGKS